jgi:hypothetical protein
MIDRPMVTLRKTDWRSDGCRIPAIDRTDPLNPKPAQSFDLVVSTN